ncbi:hypothetical protein [Sphingobium nicotianae]|uniref:MFS transporter n=1 Tax=Sphingobium nicotianae TaxID=2782607 RepID=A0A9X1D9T5_9SPHN|nr:hypothetical protein [Sphingobium nicotianae]MBT2186041.1 hypothetical protein [Sphingobium nicotianae]
MIEDDPQKLKETTTMTTNTAVSTFDTQSQHVTLLQSGGLIGFGVLALLPNGVISTLLGALVDEGRLTEAGVGVTAMFEAVLMAATLIGCSMFMAPRRLRATAFGVTVALTAANLATRGASGEMLNVVRGVAGVAEGLMMWLGASMIVRTRNPARTSALKFLVLSLSQLAVSGLLTGIVLPQFGADGAYVLIGAITMTGCILAFFAADSLGELPGAKGRVRGNPTPLGWVALFAVLVYTGALSAVIIYTVPLAQSFGLSVTSARTAVSVYLGASILGSFLAAIIAGRVSYVLVLSCTTLCFLGIWSVYALSLGTVSFILATGMSGVVAMFVAPFVTPMLIDIDPSRRTALQGGGAQLLSGGLGPFIAATVIPFGGTHMVLVASSTMLLTGIAMIMLIIKYNRTLIRDRAVLQTAISAEA